MLQIVSAPLPSETLLTPIATMADYVPAASAKAEDLRKRAKLVLEYFKKIIEWQSTEENNDGEWVREALEAEVLERWRISHGHMKSTQFELENGLAARRFIRELSKYAKDLHPKVDKGRLDAIAAIRQHRAFACIMADIDDDEVADIEVLPPRSDTPIKGPSVSFDW